MSFSKFATRFDSHTGIFQLMEDLGHAMTGNNHILMLGGGNPGHIPEVQRYFHERMQRILDVPSVFAHVIGDYDPPQGDRPFIEALARLFNREQGWDIGPENIALTAGSQFGFFLLFNMFAGEFENGRKQILLPMTPEYIGYTDVGLSDNLFTSHCPKIEKLDEHTFKYHVDFDDLEITGSTGAVCVSRPTNPTGNVLSDDEMAKLLAMAEKNQVPLIIDNAYGAPFPKIIFSETKSIWTEQIIFCMSLSKIGLPGTRTGIIVARKEIIDLITRMNAVLNLALGSFGPALAFDMVDSGEISRICETVIRPFYRNKAQRAIGLFRQELVATDYYIHKAEGAIFLWLWFPGLPISGQELYERLKRRGVLVVPGHHFFPGHDADWQHKHECIRVTYSMQDDIVRKGVQMIAEEVKMAYRRSP